MSFIDVIFCMDSIVRRHGIDTFVCTHCRASTIGFDTVYTLPLEYCTTWYRLHPIHWRWFFARSDIRRM